MDLGCGGGHVAFRLAAQVGEVVALDLSDQMLEVVGQEARRRRLTNLVTRQGVAEALPFEDGSFDLVVSRFSAHHWRDFAAGLKEARRVLKSGGAAVFIDVVAPEAPLFDTWLQGLELLRDPSHVRNYSVAVWKQTLQDTGYAPGDVTRRRLRLEFGPWVARMNTLPAHIEAIRSLQGLADDGVRDYFAIEADGSFTIDAMSITALAIG